jgi:hypothetical protein
MKTFTAAFLVAAVLFADGAPVGSATRPAPTGAAGMTVVESRSFAADVPPTPLDPVVLKGPDGKVAEGGYMISATYPVGCELSWGGSPALKPGQFYLQRVSDTQTYLVILYPPSPKQTVTLDALLVQPGRDVDVTASVTVEREGAVPPPVIVTPGPVTPPPAPPQPTPTPVNPSPFAAEGLRSLVIYEATEPGVTSPEHLSVINSAKVREYLKGKVPAGVKGRPEFRFYDDDYKPEDLRGESKLWQDAYEQAKRDRQGTGAWWLVGNGRSGESIPLPSDPEAALSILRKYGG